MHDIAVLAWGFLAITGMLGDNAKLWIDRRVGKDACLGLRLIRVVIILALLPLTISGWITDRTESWIDETERE